MKMPFSASGLPLVFGIHLHHHEVLIQPGVHGGDFALAEGVVKHLVDGRGGDAQPRGGIAVDHQVGRQALVLLVGGDVAQLRHASRARLQLRRPGVQLIQVLVRERVLVLRGAAAAADLNILVGLKKERGAGNAGELAAQPVHHLVGGDAPRPLVERLEGDEHEAHVVAAAAGPPPAKAVTDRTAGSSSVICASCALLVAHGVEADVLRRHGLAARAGPCPAAGRSPWAR